MFGFLNVYKPSGITSHDVISRLRKILHIKKIGHAGTLDPLAEGVLPVAISNATKLIDFLPNEKEYIAEFKLGFTSKSYDTECELEFYSSKKVKAEDICEVLKSFKGEIKQTPPIYSAIKVNGKVTVILKNYAPYIDKQTVKKLFEKFVRLDDKTTRTTRGTGLGLFIVKGLLSAMGGTIFIKSTPNNEFFTYVTLPSEEE